MATKYNYFCKRCGHSEDFNTKEERNEFKNKHRPKVKMPLGHAVSTVKMYNCDMELSPNTKGELVFRRKGLGD